MSKNTRHDSHNHQRAQENRIKDYYIEIYFHTSIRYHFNWFLNGNQVKFYVSIFTYEHRVTNWNSYHTEYVFFTLIND